MRLDYVVSVTRKDGSRRVLHVYGQTPPSRDDEIALPVDGQLIRARIEAPQTNAAEVVAREI